MNHENLIMMGKNERLQYVINNLSLFDEDDRLWIFRDSYISADFGFSNIELNEVIKLYKNYTPELPEDIRNEDMITVYRGGTNNGVFYGKALSWTLSFEKAEWFANRDPLDAIVRYVAKAKIDRKHIFDYVNDRNEEEVLLNPKHLTDIKQVDFNRKEYTEEEKKTMLTVMYVQQQN